MQTEQNSHVGIEIKYVSSPAGSSKQLLENIKTPHSKSLLQCAYGVVVEAGGDESELKIDDEVIIVHNSKWVRSRVMVPSRRVVKKPPDLNPILATISIGNYPLPATNIQKTSWCFVITYFLVIVFISADEDLHRKICN